VARLFFRGGTQRKGFLIVILRFGVDAPEDQDDRVRRGNSSRVCLARAAAAEGDPYDGKRKSSGMKLLLHKEDKDKRARARCGTW
jgi:hypothetical protein